MALVSDDERVELLVRLHAQQLVVLALRELQQLLDLLLLAHLGLLLLLAQFLFFDLAALDLALLFLIFDQPLVVVVVQLAAFAVLDGDDEHGCLALGLVDLSVQGVDAEQARGLLGRDLRHCAFLPVGERS